MISISKLLSSDTESEHSLMPAVRYMVRGIGLHSIEGDAADRARFRETMHGISELLVDDISAADLMVQAGVILDALGDHNRRAADQLHLQATELRNLIKILLSTIGQISPVSQACLSRLGEIEEEVTAAAGLDNIRAINTRLSKCLSDILREVEGQREETQETIEQLNQSLEDAVQRAKDGNGQDAVTGLPLRSEAELALAASGRGGEKAYAAVVVLDRLLATNLRFGNEVGDKVLSEFVRSLQRELHTEDRLFRWSGISVLALMLRPTGLEGVRNEIARIMETKLEHVVQTASRTILLPLAARWTVFPLMAAPRLIYHKLDAFAALPAATPD